MSDQADETIVVRYVADAQDAIAKQKEFEEATRAVKAQLKELAAQTGATYKSMSQAMVSSKAGELMAKAFPDKDAMARASSEINKYKAVMASALAQVNAEVRNTSTIWAAGSRNIAQSQKAEAQAVQQAQKQEADAKRAATQAWLKDNQQQANAMKYLASETKKSADQTKSSFSTMAVAIGAALGISAVNIVRNFFQTFTNYAKEAVQSGYEFAKGMFQLEVGVNALRRAGTNITFGDVLTQLQKLKTEFGIFSTKELVVGASAFLNLNRDMGFTKDQLFSLQEAIATLAVVNGRSMDEVQKTVALALSSGYTEGLQRLGVSINRVTIAEEAARLGWDKGYTALTEQQRALATYNLVLRKTAVYSKDLLGYQESLPGAIDTTTAAITDATAETGKLLLGIKYLGKQYELLVKERFNELISGKKLDLFDYMNLPGTMVWKLISYIVKLSEALYKVKKHWEDIKNAFKEVFIVPLEPIFEIISKLVKEVKSELTELAKLKPFSTIIDAAKAFKFILGEVKESLGGVIEYLDILWKTTPPGMMLDKASEFINRVKSILSEKITVKSPEVAKIGAEALTEDQIAAVESAGEKILDLQTEYDNELRDMAIDLQRDLAEIEREGKEEIYHINVEHAQKMKEIADKAAEQLRDAQLRYDLDVQQAWDEYYSNLASAAENHSNKLLKIEEDYQEKLKRLKEGFLMDMEDALHERDARQVLRLIRQYNLDKTQATRERDNNLRDESRAYQEQLHDLDRQRNDRLKKLAQEFRLRTEAIEEQKNKELDIEKEKNRLALIHQIISDIEKRRKRRAQYDEDLIDLDTHLKDRADKIMKGLIDEGIITQNGMQAFIDIMKTFIGPGGISDGLYKYFVSSAYAAANAAALAMSQAFAILSGSFITYPGGKDWKEPPKTKYKAQGGMEYADKATTAVFGEAGPELALFLPLRGGMGSLSTSTKTPVPEMKQGDKGRLQVEVLLGAGLEGRIIDKTLNNVASVVLRSIRQ